MSLKIIFSEIKSLKSFQKVLQGPEWDVHCYLLQPFPSTLPPFLKYPHRKEILENCMEYPLDSPTHVLLSLGLSSKYNIPCKKPASNDELCLPTLDAYTWPHEQDTHPLPSEGQTGHEQSSQKGETTLNPLVPIVGLSLWKHPINKLTSLS